MAVIPIYSAAAAFEVTALEFFGRIAETTSRRRCASSGAYDFDLHRRVTLAYACAWGMTTFTAEIKADVTAKLAEWGLDYERCPGGPGCDTTDTPWGLAWALTEEVKAFAARDGWNADGSMSRRHNLLNYSDWRSKPYVPANAPWELTVPTRWKPLLERDGRGFLYHQVGASAVLMLSVLRVACSYVALSAHRSAGACRTTHRCHCTLHLPVRQADLCHALSLTCIRLPQRDG